MAVVTAAVAFFCQAPALVVKRTFFSTVVAQGRDPFTPMRLVDEGTHEAKLAFRLVPPLVVDTLHLSVEVYYVMQAVLGLASMAGLLWLFHRVGYSRRGAAGLVLALAFTYMGAVWFVDTQPYFDAVAASALVFALCIRHPAAVFVGGSIALWTDERALLACGVVALFHLYRDRRDSAVATAMALVTYAALRIWLGQRYGLSTGKSEVGPSVFIDYWTAMPVAIVLSLEGLAVLLVIAYSAAVRTQEWLVAAAGVLTAGSLAIAVMVNDVTRSTVYALPGVVFALVYMTERPERERRWVMWALVACILIPTSATIVTSGAVFDHVSFLYPLPIRLLI